MGFLGFFLLYAMRINLSVALVDMVEREAAENFSVTNNCPVDDGANSTLYQSGFTWSNKKQGDVLGAFYYGYIFTQFPAGVLATKFGAKYIFGLGVFITGILTLATPVAAYQGVDWLIVLRVFEGVIEAVSYPSFNALIGKWAPHFEKSFFSAFSVSGSIFGNVLIQPMVGYLCSLSLWDGWPLAFYAIGLMTIIWFGFWVFLIHETPREHPRISWKEVQYIESNINVSAKQREIPWKGMLTSLSVYGLVFAHISCTWINYGIMACLPQYLSNVFNFEITSNGFISAAPWLSFWISIQLFSYLTDRLRTYDVLSTTVLRKANQLISTVLPGTFLVLAGYAGCNSTLAVALIVIAMFFFGASFSANMCNSLDLSPQYAGVIFGIINTIGTIPGFVAPKVVAFITNSDVHSVKLWREVFYVFAGVAAAGGVSFLIMGSGELQPWARGDVNSDGYELLDDKAKADTNNSDDGKNYKT